MREQCKIHNVALSPDGQCIMCRRPAASRFQIRQETEDLLSRIVTACLGFGLVAATASLLYVLQLDSGYTGPRELGAGSQPTGASVQRVAAANAPSFASKPPTTPAVRATPSAPPRVRVPRPPLVLDAQRVEMYAAPWCYVCDRARDFLVAGGADLVERDVEREPRALRDLARRNPAETLPTFVVAGETIVGFSPYRLEEALRGAPQPLALGAPVAASAPAAAIAPTPELSRR